MIKNNILALFVLLHCINLNAQKPLPSGSVRLVASTQTGQDAYAPFRYGDKVFFTSIGNKDHQNNSATRLFSAELNKVEASLLSLNPKKASLHASNMTMTADGKTAYYTLCKDGTQGKCTIWSREKEYNGEWGTAKKLPGHINLRGHTATQPSIGYDWTLKKKVLYFASDRPGGKGGMDIWQSVIALDGTFGEPIPLPFNTEKDEVTPFFQLSEQTLFFSSNGLEGHGGFDVFSTKKISKEDWGETINVGTAINTKYNETYFTYHTHQQKSYFTSNRPTDNLSLTNTAQDQSKIYEATSTITLTIPAFNIHDMSMLYDISAQVFDETTGQKHTAHQQPFDPDLQVTLLPNRSYKIVVLKNGFMPAVVEADTEGMIFPAAMQQEVHLFLDETLSNNNRETYHQRRSTQVNLSSSTLGDSPK